MRKTLPLLSVLLFLATYGPLAHAQPALKIARVGVFDTFCREARHNKLRESLREIGYIEGENLHLVNNCTKYKSIGRKERAADMVRLKPDVIVARSAPGIRAIMRATSTVPIVMIRFGDPVRTGDVESFARPGGNTTGVSGVLQDFAVKSLEVFKEALPEISCVVFLKWHTVKYPEKTAIRAKALGINFQIANVENLEDLDEIFLAMVKEKVDGVVVRSHSRISRGQRQIIKLAEDSRLPAIYMQRNWVKRGGLMSYGADQREMYRRAARQVRKILNGAKAGELPIERPTHGELVINLKTAEKLGVAISPETLMFADEVIR
jgi:putative ABC transport system substrate-binding protein